jgi:hypothetical protein
MIKRLLQSALLVIIGISIIAGSFRLTENVAYAQAPAPSGNSTNQVAAGTAGCLAGTLIGGLVSKWLAAIAEQLPVSATIALIDVTTSVPVIDKSNLVQNAYQSVQQQSLSNKEYVLDPTFRCIAQVILRQMTNDIVAWINGGFKGNPAFVSNPSQFLVNIADRTAEDFLRGTALEFLCSPFKLQIRLAIALNYNSASAPPQCTWSQVFGNVSGAADQAMNDFTGGDFSSGGLPGWFQLTQNNSNNSTGSYLEAAANLDFQIGAKKSIELGKLSWGNGFLSYCTESNPDGSCKKGSKIATPGKVIESQLENALNTDLQGLQLADEINEVLVALMNQLLTKLFNPGGGGSGLSGATVDNYSLNGGFCNGRITSIKGDSVTVEWSVTSTDRGATYTWIGTDGLSGSGSPISKVYTRSGTKTATVRVSGSEGTNSFSCTAPVIINEGGGDGACVPEETKNVSDRQPSALSAQYRDDAQQYPPSAANDGQTSGGMAIGYSIPSDPNPWWQVDTGTSTMIEKVEIWERGDHPLVNYYVIVSETPFLERVPVEQVIAAPGTWEKLVPDAVRSPTVVIVGQKGRYVRIQRTDTDFLELVEVAVTGTITKICPTTPPNPNPNPNPIPGNLPPLPSPSPIPATACRVNPGDNLQDKINDCQGGTVVFNAGTYNIGSKLNLHSNTTYLGGDPDPEKVVFNASNGYSMETRGKVGVRIEGMTFRGTRGINIEGGERITVYRNVFRNITGNNAVRIATYLKNSQITDNRIVSSPGITGIESTRPTTFEFVRLNKNVCFDVWECIHVFGWDYQNLPPRSHDVEINDNFVRAAHRHALEIQDSWDRLEIARNDIDDFTPNANSGNDCPTGGFMGISQATGGSINVKVHDNKVSGDGRGNSGPSCFSAHEIISETTEVYNNTYSNWGWGMLTSYKPGNVNIHDNKYCNITNRNGVPTGNGNTYQAGNCL